MNDQTRSEVRHEVQDFLASREMFDQPKGKVELAPVAQKAIDGYLSKRINAAVALLTLCAGGLGVVGLFGYENMGSAEERIGRIEEHIEREADRAYRKLKKFETDVEDYNKKLKQLSDKTKVAQDDLATAIEKTETKFKIDVGKYDEQLGALRESTQKAQASAATKTKEIGSNFKSEIETASERVKEIREKVETDLDELQEMVRNNQLQFQLSWKDNAWRIGTAGDCSPPDRRR